MAEAERRITRSRSPAKRKDTGFKWKENRRRDRDTRQNGDRESHKSHRDQYRPKSRSRSPRRRSPRRDEMRRETAVEEQKEGKERKKERKAVPAAPTQQMIVVYVNDRLGTKKAIPCFATDPIKDFKVIVASMIGRQPHEILLKRQGERPFKDQLTLQDYGVSNNVQLDLEVDTGD